jgi:hypothetical protein
MKPAQRPDRIERTLPDRPCAACADFPPVVKLRPGDAPPPTHCPKCGRALGAILVRGDFLDTPPRVN